MSQDASTPSPLQTLFPLAHIALATAAAALWYLRPQLGPLPLLLALPPLLLSFILHLRRGALPLRALLTPYFLPLLLFLLTAAGGLWAAYDPGPAQAKFWLIVAGVLLFYALAHYTLTTSLSPHSSVLHALPSLGFTVLGLAVSLFFLATNDWNTFPAENPFLTAIGRAIQSLLPTLPVDDTLNPNVVGGLLAFSIPFTTHALLTTLKNRASTRHTPHATLNTLTFFFLLPSLLFILFTFLLTSSRGATIALTAAATIAILWLPARAVAHRLRLNPRTLYLAILLIPPFLALILFILFPQPSLDAVTSLLNRLPGPGHDNRLHIYRNALILVMDYPIIGAGLDGFMMLYSSYSYLLHVGFITHAHNLYLDLAIEQGLLAPLSLLLLVLIALPTITRSLNPHSTRHTPHTTPAILALLFILLHGLVDDVFYGSRAVFLLFTPFALLLPPVRNRRVRRFAYGVRRFANRGKQDREKFLSLLIPIVVFSSILVLPSSFFYSNLAAIQQHKAELSLYNFPEYGLQDQVRREVDLSQPIANYQRALEINPTNPAANRRLGQILLSLGQYREARQHLLRAYEVTPWDNATRQLLGEAQIVNGYLIQGAALWTTVNNQQNQLQARVAWYNRIDDHARHAYVREIAGIVGAE